MKIVSIFIPAKRIVYVALLAAIIVILSSVAIFYASMPASSFEDPKSGIIVIDPGHGGIDGGVSKDGILEKDINLSIAKRLGSLLEQAGYKPVMTRDGDVSLDYLCDLDVGRHHKDLQARVDIINSCNAQLFASIHVNCNFNRPATDGSIVFYSEKYTQNRELAYCVQRALNAITVDGRRRTVHDPQQGGYFLLKHSLVPGVIIETAFISNEKEKRLLVTEDFQDKLAAAIADGIIKYLRDCLERQCMPGSSQ